MDGPGSVVDRDGRWTSAVPDVERPYVRSSRGMDGPGSVVDRDGRLTSAMADVERPYVRSSRGMDGTGRDRTGQDGTGRDGVRRSDGGAVEPLERPARGRTALA